MHVDEHAALEPSLPASLSTVSPGADERVHRIHSPVRGRSFRDLRDDADHLRRTLAASTCVMVAWSLFEVPWEVDADSSGQQIAAVLTAKALLMIIAGMALRGRRFARYVLLFVCVTSVLAIAPELPGEFSQAPWLAVLSTVECVTKLATLTLIALHLKPRLR
ncbi:hypothetical protein P9239_00740 [Caballeronia sp. LZ062]|uniref:hypothetical protein n=1 Tax=unclassified Caballeronia TaxID=2646786 RepID=UPI0028661B20|nr:MULTISPECIES: hypothetical protein [unclassified Caballeronia]MDR5857333.1 hypothetical protein [Caballeronia sp. LZ050]MDR5868884.1 hypothetical protein [Caballeronia sp. LZ062]